MPADCFRDNGSNHAAFQVDILITGCSSGIGYVSAVALHKLGWQVFATARNEADIARLKAEGLNALYLDYTDSQSIADLADQVLHQTNGKLYALFNNGAYGQPGAVEDLSTDVLRLQFETNFFGWHELTRRLIPAMRTNGAGRIVQCSSVLGFVSPPYIGAYNASKHALEALSDAMRIELMGTGIKVVLIEPGPIWTKFTERALKAFNQNIDAKSSHHGEIYDRMVENMEAGQNSSFKLPPEAVYQKLLKALNNANPKPRYFVTIPTYMAAITKRTLPTRLQDWLLARARG